MAQGLWRDHHRHGVHGRVLGAGRAGSRRRLRLRGAAGGPAPRAQRPRSKDRREGLSVAAAAAQLRPAFGCVSSHAGARAAQDLPSPSQVTRRSLRAAGAPDAEGARGDECPAAQGPDRHHRRDWHGHPARHRGRRARPRGARTASSSDGAQLDRPDRHGAERQLLGRAGVRAATDPRVVRLHSSPAQGLRRPIEAYMASLSSRSGPDTDRAKPARRSRRKNQPHFDLRSEMVRICGVDLTAEGRRTPLDAKLSPLLPRSPSAPGP